MYLLIDILPKMASVALGKRKYDKLNQYESVMRALNSNKRDRKMEPTDGAYTIDERNDEAFIDPDT